MSHYKLVANPNCCELCEEKDGKWISKSVDLEHPVHPNCKCDVIEELSKKEKELEEKAMNDSVQEEFYTGFTYINPMTEEKPIPEAVVTTYDFGSTLVQVSPLGDFLGSDSEGNGVEETVTIESLRNVLTNIKEEILVDIDHASEKQGEDRNTEAAAWASDFMVIDSFASPLDNGLYARLKWTKKGRELVESRTYRFLSPVWLLDDKNQPVILKSIALTNTPALKGISPIINQEPSKDTQDNQEILTKPNKTNIMDKEILEMCGIEATNEEITDEEKSRALKMIAKWKTDSEEKAKIEADKLAAEKEAEIKNCYVEAIKNYDVEDTDELYDLYKKDPESFVKMLSTCGKEKAKNEEIKVVEEEEEVEEEVIPKEALNSVSVDTSKLSLKTKAETLHGDDFIAFVRKNKDQLISEW